MESRILILFCTLLSLFLFFSVASAIWMGLRRHGRLSGMVWGLLFLLPAIPFSPLLHIHSPAAPVEVTLTVDASGDRTLSLLPKTEEPPEPPSRLVLSESGSPVLRDPSETDSVTAAPSAATSAAGITIPGWLWDTGIFLLAALLFLWAMSAAAQVIHRICVYAGNIHFLTSRSVICRDERLEAVFAGAVSQVKLHRKPVLRVVEEGIALSPCTAGLFTPTVYLSHRQASLPADSLEYIFLHELCHVKRHDFPVKLLALFTTSLYSFSPFTGPVRKQVCEDCELGCDRAVLALIGKNRRDRYLETILTIAEETMVRPRAISDTGHVVNGDLFSFAASSSGTGKAKDLLLRRIKSLRKEEPGGRRHIRPDLCAAILGICLLHMGLFAAADTAPMADPFVDLESVYLETIIREYFDLPAAVSLRRSHLDGIHTLEFSLSRKLDRDNGLLPATDNSRTLAMSCLVNEGKYPTDARSDIASNPVMGIFEMQDWLADGVTPAFQEKTEAAIPLPHPLTEPLWLDRDYNCAIDILPDVCPLSALERYLPMEPALCARLLEHYTCLDGTDEALDAYTTMLYKAVIADSDLATDASEAEITAAFLRYCGERGITLDPDRGDLLTQLYESRQAEILAVSPAALFQPMVFLDPTLPEDTVEELAGLLLTEGVSREKLLTGMTPDATGRYTLPFGDLVLFENLRTVVLDDRLSLDDTVFEALSGRRCSVVEK